MARMSREQRQREIEELENAIFWELYESACCGAVLTYGTAPAGEASPGYETMGVNADPELFIMHAKEIRMRIRKELEDFQGVWPSEMRRRDAVRRLMAHGLDRHQIATEMGCSESTVRRAIPKCDQYGWWKKEPQLHREVPIEEMRRRNALFRKHDGEKLRKEFASYCYTEFRGEGFVIEREDAQYVVDWAMTKALKSFDEHGTASFKTYFMHALENCKKDYKQKLASRLKRLGYTRIGKKADDQKMLDAA